ncbi:MAG TPA: protein kinase [Thermoanaerobaculia bacterium]|nr:protein kinase [Thermoanaerobaculia bacterium]
MPEELARIGPYRLARRLGQGGMGEVFLAWDERLGRRVAVKRIRRGEPTAKERERLRREAQAAARLSHPSIVQVYDWVEDASGDAIVLEYVEGRTLREMLGEGLPALALAVRLAREIAAGLAAAHAVGLVHRDLKAENVIVTPDGRAKVLDFGIAKVFGGGHGETLTAHGAVLGTLHAMSPEQARSAEVDARSDLFSLGVLLYEMLTGRSPFLGKDPLDTLQRVASHHPPSVADLRPEVPRELSDLVDRLLAKSREDRPGTAGEVAQALAAFSPAGAEVWQPLGGEGKTLGEIPTSFVPTPAIALPHGLASTAERDRRLPMVLGAVLVVAALAVTGYILRKPSEPLRVAVLAPRTAAGAEEDLVTSSLVTAALSILASLDGMAPLDTAQVADAASPLEAARTAAADEVVVFSMERQGPRGTRVSLRRIQGQDGRLLWTGSFLAPSGSEDRDLRLLADTVAVHLRRAYPERRLRPGAPELAVSDRDYAELLRVKARIDQGNVPLEPEIEKLEALVRSSPRFLEGHLLMAQAAQSLYSSTQEPGRLERAIQATQDAERLAPGDPRALTAHFRIALTGHRLDEAQAALDALIRLNPGDPNLLVLSGQLAEGRGDLKQAIADLSDAVDRAPSWSNLYRLAVLETRAGRTADARRHFEELLERSPDNLWGLDRLGNLELLEGDPRRAERIYLGLVRRQPLRAYYTNLGLARLLLGRPAEAVAAYRQALALEPDHLTVLLNLADAELARGREEEARELYRRTLARLEETAAAGGLSAEQKMAKAQCLAHLGNIQEALKLTQRTVGENGDNPEVLYAASLVYALAGDRASALLNAGLALEKGVQPRWFTLAAFGPLRDDPELQALLRR